VNSITYTPVQLCHFQLKADFIRKSYTNFAHFPHTQSVSTTTTARDSHTSNQLCGLEKIIKAFASHAERFSSAN
jgi:hypothetical protein